MLRLSTAGRRPAHDYLANWNRGWGWLLWFGVWFLLNSSFGHWGYAYRVNQRYTAQPGKNALDILNERYARGVRSYFKDAFVIHAV